MRFYEEKNAIVLDGNEKTNHYSTTIFIEEEIKYYMLKEINYRKELAMKITLIVKDMHFQFQYWPSRNIFDIFDLINNLILYLYLRSAVLMKDLNIFDNFLLLNNEYVPSTTFLIQKKHS